MKHNISIKIGEHTLELRNIKVFEEMSDETNAFIADLFVDDKAHGKASNEGRGGSNSYWLPRELNTELETECHKHMVNAITPYGDFSWEYDLDYLISKMVYACWYDRKTTLEF